MYRKTAFFSIISLLVINNLFAQISTSLFNDGIHHWNLEHKDRTYHRFSESEYLKIADNLIAYQNADGGWMKNIDWLGELNTDSVKRSLNEHYQQSTLDNRNTYSQIAYLAQVYTLTKIEKYKVSAIKGLMYILNTQKGNGGWRGWDVDAITFNDDVTTGALELFRDIIQGDENFKWINRKLRAKIKKAFDKGISLILKCQIVQNGIKTAWGQQHDNVTLESVGARTFELSGITANESAEICRLLMGIKNPSKDVVNAVDFAVLWFRKVKIDSLRIERISLPEDKIINHEYPYDNVVVVDPSAKPIWARYYEISDNTPFMCTRSGEKVWKLEDVNAERRTGYAWYGYWPESVLDDYDAWKASVSKIISE